MATADRHLFLSILFITVFSLVIAFTAGCGDDDDDSGGSSPIDDDSDDDDADDDDSEAGDDDSDDDDADDDTGATLTGIVISPSTRAIPQGLSKAFFATAYYDDGSSSTDEAFEFSSSDEGLLTVDENGLATGLAAGEATITVRLGGMEDDARIVVGADVFFLDALAGTLGAYNRGTGEVTDDYLPELRGAVAPTPNDMQIWRASAYIVDSGHGATDPDDPGGIVEVDLYAGQVNDAWTVEGLDNPWAIKIDQGLAFITGNLSDNLAVVDLETLSAELIDLPEGCAPAEVAIGGGRVFVACTYFDPITFGYGSPGQVIALDLAEDTMTAIDTTQVNPGSLALSPDGSLYVVCTGNFWDELGVIDQIDPAAGAVVESISLGMAPGPLAISGDGKAFIGDIFAGENNEGFIYVLDTENNEVLRGDDDPIVIPDASWIAALAVSPLDGALYAADWGNGQSVVIDTGDYAFLAQPPTANALGYAFWK